MAPRNIIILEEWENDEIGRSISRDLSFPFEEQQWSAAGFLTYVFALVRTTVTK